MGKIFFRNYGKEAKLTKGKTILSYCQELGIDISSLCGGIGACGQCVVKVEGEGLNEPGDIEKKFIKETGYRLACQARVEKEDANIYVEVPKRRYKVLERGKVVPVPLEPVIGVVGGEGETRRVRWEWNGIVREIGDYEGEMLGLALDIGTTTLAMYCVDLEKGLIVGTTAMKNPQEVYGSDVIARITRAREKKQHKLETVVRSGVNEMIEGLKVDPQHVYEMVVVGNSTMRDLFLGHPVDSLGVAPFEPFTKDPVNRSGGELGIKMNPKGNVYALPLIGGFVGADTSAAILATGMHKRREVSMMIDIGTNTEIVIGNKDRMIATSCASGPAFEGSGIKCGSGAVEGAIHKVEIDESMRVRYETIGDLPPVGICGSGLIDILAQMLDRGIIDKTGKFKKGGREFVVVAGERPIKIDGEDIDKLKLAKAAVCVGNKVLLEKYGTSLGEVKKIYLAGAFGNYINVENSYRIGLLPEVSLSRVERVGNAALEGARQVLVSRKKRKEVEEMVSRIEHLNLESESNFLYRLMGELVFDQCTSP